MVTPQGVKCPVCLERVRTASNRVEGGRTIGQHYRNGAVCEGSGRTVPLGSRGRRMKPQPPLRTEDEAATSFHGHRAPSVRGVHPSPGLPDHVLEAVFTNRTSDAVVRLIATRPGLTSGEIQRLLGMGARAKSAASLLARRGVLRREGGHREGRYYPAAPT